MPESMTVCATLGSMLKSSFVPASDSSIVILQSPILWFMVQCVPKVLCKLKIIRTETMFLSHPLVTEEFLLPCLAPQHCIIYGIVMQIAIEINAADVPSISMGLCVLKIILG